MHSYHIPHCLNTMQALHATALYVSRKGVPWCFFGKKELYQFRMNSLSALEHLNSYTTCHGNIPHEPNSLTPLPSLTTTLERIGHSRDQQRRPITTQTIQFPHRPSLQQQHQQQASTGQRQLLILPRQIIQSYSNTTALFARNRSSSNNNKITGSSSKNHDDRDMNDFAQGRNPGLASVISQGIQTLEDSASTIATVTKRQTKANLANKSELRPRQLQEAKRIQDTVVECLDELVATNREASQLLSIHGEPIAILKVQVNRDIKQAKVFWTLPLSFLLDDIDEERFRLLSSFLFSSSNQQPLKQSLYKQLMDHIQTNLEQRNGAKLLQRHVSTQLRFYYPPKLRFVPASDTMAYHFLEELVDEDKS